MRAPSLPWRAILWIERFLPTAPTPPAEPSAAAKRRAAWVSPIIVLAVLVPNLVRHWHDGASVIVGHHVALEQAMLVVVGCVIIAAAAFGAKAWHDAEGFR